MPRTFIEKKYLRVYIIILLGFIFFGLSGILTGAAMPEIIKEFGWSYKETSVVLIATPLSFFMFSLLTGHLLSRLSIKCMMSSALLFLVAGLAGFGVFSSVLYNALMKLLIGAGCGILEVVSNYSVGKIEKKGSSHLMGILHSFFSIGSILGPFLITVFLSVGFQWISVFRISSIAVLPLVLVVLVSDFSIIQMNSEEKGHAAGESPLKVVLHIFPILSFLIITFYVALEMGITEWSAEFLFRTKAFTSAKAASFVSLFWIGLLIGRLGNPFFLKRFRFYNQLVLLISIALVSTAQIIFLPVAALLPVFFVLAGYGCSSMYPLVMTIIANNVEKNSHTVVGLTSAGGGLGAFIFPIITGSVSDAYGIGTGFKLYLVVGGFVLIAVLLYRSVIIKKNKVH